MSFQRKFYPEEWDRLREADLRRVGGCCEVCGVKDRTVLYNPKKVSEDYPQGMPYMVYLSRAHQHQYQTWLFEAETMMLCQACHRRFDRRFRRKRVELYQPVGVALLRVRHRGRWVLAAEAHWVHDLLDVVLSLPVGTEFELCLEVMTWRVGRGRYRKEQGACREVSGLLASGL